MAKYNPLREKSYSLGRTIQKLRQKKDLTQEKLAERAGITLNYMGIIEIGNKMPSMRVLIKIAEVLEVRTKDLIPF
ncbi:MAG: helix-turn-helix transcriptional regulator [Patescibacteria group bacterium]